MHVEYYRISNRDQKFGSLREAKEWLEHLDERKKKETLGEQVYGAKIDKKTGREVVLSKTDIRGYAYKRVLFGRTYIEG